jgi:16S rRNA (uracil1498-N3)-methyltransferase
MSAGRFFVAPDVLADPARVELPPAVANQVRAVLRLRSGDQITLLASDGIAHVVELTDVSRERVVGRDIAQATVATEPRVQVILYQGLLKAAKFEWIVQKGTEIGLSAIVPVQCRRSVVGADEVSAAKLARWRAIAAEAAEQSDRGRVPEVWEPIVLGWPHPQGAMHCDPTSVAAPEPGSPSVVEAGENGGARFSAPASHAIAADALALLAYEAEGETPRRTIRDALAGSVPAVIHLYIGPEGGFAPEEVALAQAHGVRIVTLGPRILRAETAALVATTLALDAVGEMA